MPTQKNTQVAVHAFKMLRSLYQLSTDLHASESLRDLIFRILNNSIALLPYRRAVIWSLDGKKPVLLGVSGREEINPQSPFAKRWEPVVAHLRRTTQVQIVQNIPKDLEHRWQQVAEKTHGLSVLWIPISVDGNPVAGLWLERWGRDTWDAAECDIMTSYAQNLRLAWRQFKPKSWRRRFTSFRFRMISTTIAAVVLASFIFVPAVSLRVVAPCEIVPKAPKMVAAPLDGVIKEILVKPGDYVKPGDLLFMYDDRIILKDLKVAQKQVEIIKSQYDRMQYKSFIDHEAMEEIQSLKYRLEQEQVRLNLAESKADQLKIHARVTGVCMIDHPEYWQGRPVQIGERVMMIFNPNDSKIKISLPEKDNIDFSRNRTVRIILNAAPTKSYAAELNFVAPQTSKNPQGDVFFLAEAMWLIGNPKIKVGSKGTAIIRGEKVTVIYWLLRKPVASIRQFIGL